ncbi:MAG: hypothetical protein RQ899_02570 [Pseudomonadales bacterium]|nr:hypothetical protein [Pseudomonadales bacterium]
MNFSVEVKHGKADVEHVFHGEAVNISQHNIELACGGDLLQSLQAQDCYPYNCELSFRLPGDKQAFRVDCRLLSFRRLSQHRYRYILDFVQFAEEGLERLEDYFSEFLSASLSASQAEFSHIPCQTNARVH